MTRLCLYTIKLVESSCASSKTEKIKISTKKLTRNLGKEGVSPIGLTYKNTGKQKEKLAL